METPHNYDHAVALFKDWCEATGTPWPPSLDRYDDFHRDIPCAESTRLSRLRAIANHLGWQSTKPAASEARRNAHLVVLPEALRRLARMGAGYGIGADWWVVRARATRDDFVVALLVQMGLTRAQVSHLPGGSIAWTEDGITILGQTVPTTPDDPSACPACAVARWLAVAWWIGHWGPNVARAEIIRNDRHRIHTGVPPLSDHTCHTPGDDRWRLLSRIALRVGPHGDSWEYDGLTIRSISAIASRRLDVAAPDLSYPVPDSTPSPTGPQPEPSVWKSASMQELLDGLEEAGRRADEVNSRIQEALAAAANTYAHRKDRRSR